MKDYPTLH